MLILLKGYARITQSLTRSCDGGVNVSPVGLCVYRMGTSTTFSVGTELKFIVVEPVAPVTSSVAVNVTLPDNQFAGKMKLNVLL